MKRYFTLAIAAVIALGSLWVSRTSEKTGNSPRQAENRGEARSNSGYETPLDLSSMDGQARDSVTFQPQRRYQGATIIEQWIHRENPGVYEAKYLLKGEDSRIPFILLEERYSADAVTGEFSLSSQEVSKGNEVMFNADPTKVDVGSLERMLEERGWSVSWRSRLSHYVQVATSNPSLGFVDQAIEWLGREFPDATVSKDHLHFSTSLPSEYRGPVHWHLRQINAVDAWSLETGSDEVVLGILDTGCFTEHSDLTDNIFVNPGEIPDNGIDDDGNGFVDDARGWDFYDDDPIANDETGHGTHVSGITGAVGDNGEGAIGVGWNIKILPLKVGGSSGLSSSAIAEALRYVTDLKVRGTNIVATNNSYGSSSPNTVAQEVISRHEEEGILFVAAAGNDGLDIDSPGSDQFPAGFEESNVISVANSTQADDLSSGSNYGLQSVDIAAPGQEIYSTDSNGGYLYLTGTSMSSPIVAGAIGLLASHEPDLSGAEIKQRLLDTAKRVDGLGGKILSGGRLDLLAALEPSFTRHRIETPTHPNELSLLPRYDIPVEIEVDAKPEATVLWERVSGPESIELTERGDGIFVVRFDREGVYRIRFTARLNGIDRWIDRVFVVGAPHDVADGLLHSWDMEGSGDVLVDMTGSGEGELIGTTRVETPLGGGLDFSGSNSFARFNAGFSPQVTLSAFVRSDDLLSSPHPRIIDAPDYYLYFSTRGTQDVPDGNANALKFYSNRTGDFGVWHSPPDTISQGEWLHVVATYDSAELENDPRLYINGRRQPVRVQRLPVGVQTSGGGEAYLGDRADGTRAWDGQMDEVRIYRRVITDGEVVRLSARYLDALWSDYSIVSKSEWNVGQSIELVLEDANGLSPQGEFEWSIASENGFATIAESNQASVSVQFEAIDNARLYLKAIGSSSTRYYVYDLFLEPFDIQSGIYAGETGSGGIVWLEIDENGVDGSIALLDLESGFRRFREPIAIDMWGNFSSARDATHSIIGDFGDGFSGRAEGLALEFGGELTQPQSGVSGYEGTYSGGVIGRGGELVELRVTKTGDLFFWSDGVEADAAAGVVDSLGRFVLTTERGREIEGTIDPIGGFVFGSVESGFERMEIYLKRSEQSSENRYVNLSTRGLSDSGENILIGGFTLISSGKRSVLIRGIGPDLARRNVSNPMSDPTIDLLRGGEVIASNDDWGTNGDLSALVDFSERSGASPLEEGSADAALLANLDPGVYTVFVRSKGAQGEALFEVFDDGNEPDRALVNVSSRGPVRGESQALIGGFSVIGPEPKLTLIRGIGPGLADKGVVSPLADPKIELYSDQAALASNDNWTDGSFRLTENGDWVGPASSLIDSFKTSGAFDLAGESKDAAMLVWLNPGVYTVVLKGEDGSEGVALIEVYELD